MKYFNLKIFFQLFILKLLISSTASKFKLKKYSMIEHLDTDLDKLKRINKHLRDEYFSNPVIEIISKLTHLTENKRKSY
jgi:hypothetical protein